MNILAITCFTGGQELADMTRNAVLGVAKAMDSVSAKGSIRVCAQGTEASFFSKMDSVHGVTPFPEKIEIGLHRVAKNRGFAFGMDYALGMGLMGKLPDAVLCFNNDLEFPDPLWLVALLDEFLEERVMVPATNFTACKEQQADGSVDCEPIDVPATPAVCWLIPWTACKILFEHSGGMGKLFREDIGMAWGEDGFAAAAFQRDLDPNPFRIVPRSFVRHLGERTSSQISAGEKMKSYRKSQELIKTLLT